LPRREHARGVRRLTAAIASIPMPRLACRGRAPVLQWAEIRLAMKIRLFAALLLCVFLGNASRAAEASATAASDLKSLVGRVNQKLQAGQSSAAELKDELAAFDALLAKYQGQKTDDVARILFMEAALYAQVLGDNSKARELMQQLKADFPGTAPAKDADEALTALERQAKAEAAKAALVGKPAPELHFKWASSDGLKSLAELKGKVVVLDFWATWCGPCVASFPNVRELAAYYKGSDVAIVGVTSIQGFVVGLEPARIDTKGNPDKEMALMKDYIKAKDITWTVAFSDEPVFNPDYGITGIPYMAIIAPDGTVRHAGLHPAMPHADKVEKINAILKEFGKVAPSASPNK
jgi:thiol-disulfide isomerase/thioredoxin